MKKARFRIEILTPQVGKDMPKSCTEKPRTGETLTPIVSRVFLRSKRKYLSHPIEPDR
jgi:hypothetical protein